MSSSLQQPLLGDGGSSVPQVASGTMVPPGPVRVSSAGGPTDVARQGSASSEKDPTCWESCCMCCGAPKEAQSKRPVVGHVRAAPDLLALDLASPEGAAFAQVAGGLWVSHILQRLWPHIAATVEGMVLDVVPPLLEDSLPKWMEGVSLDKFELGKRPPTVLNVHVDQVDDDDVAEVRLHLEVEWTSQSDIQLTVRPLPAMLHQMMPSLLQAMVQFMTSLTVGVQDLSIRAQVLLTLAPLAGEAPVVKALHVSMLRAPSIDYSLTLTKGELSVLNVVKPWLVNIIATCFTMYVMPEIVHVPIATGQLPVQKPEGVVLVRVLKATDVPKMDYWGHSDTYAELYVRSRIRRRTPVVKKSANPEWPSSHATFTFLVHARQYQSLVLEMWDADEGMLDSTDDAIGHAIIGLSTLQPSKEYAMALPVLNATTKHLLESPSLRTPGAAGGLDASPAGPSGSGDESTPRYGPKSPLLPRTATAGGSAAGTPASGSGKGTPTAAAAAAAGMPATPEFMPHLGRHGVDASSACARSTADVKDTRVHVVVRYVPASLAPLLRDEVGAPGVFQMKVKKVTVPDLASLPLRGRAYITGQRPACNPPVSYALRPLRGKDKVTGEDLSTRKDIPFWFDGVWDVLGSAAQIAECVWVLELVEGINTQAERVVASVDMPVSEVIKRRVATMAGGVAGGDYTLKSNNGYVFDMMLLWGPLLGDTPAAPGQTEEHVPFKHSATTPSNAETDAAADAAVGRKPGAAAGHGGGGALGSLPESASMPAHLR